LKSHSVADLNGRAREHESVVTQLRPLGVLPEPVRHQDAERAGYGVFAGQLRMWRQSALAQHRRMRFPTDSGWTVVLLDAVLSAPPVAAAMLVDEQLTVQGRP